MRQFTQVVCCVGFMLAPVGSQAMDHGGMVVQSVEPSWSAYIGGAVLNRSKPEGVNNFDFGWNGGVEADIRSNVWPNYQLQVRYLGVDRWSEEANTQYGLTEGNSNLHSLEFNLHRQQTDRLKLLGGLRLMNTREFSGAGGDTINIRNRLYGAQLGAEFLAWDGGGPLTISTGLKAGIFYNRAGREANFGPLQQSRRSNTAVGGEWDIVARYEVTDQMSIRAGFQVLVLNRVASFDAPQIASTNAGDPVNNNSRRVHHGATVGFEFKF